MKIFKKFLVLNLMYFFKTSKNEKITPKKVFFFFFERMVHNVSISIFNTKNAAEKYGNYDDTAPEMNQFSFERNFWPLFMLYHSFNSNQQNSTKNL